MVVKMACHRKLSCGVQLNKCGPEFQSLLVDSDHDSVAAKLNHLAWEANDNLDIQFVRYVAVNITGLRHKPAGGPILHWIDISINFHRSIINILTRISTPVHLGCAKMVRQ